QMREEGRKDVVKQLNKTMEDHKTAIRNIRRDGNDQIKKAAKDKLISADDEKRANDEVQQLTDAEIKRIEDLFKAKEKEIMTVCGGRPFGGGGRGRSSSPCRLFRGLGRRGRRRDRLLSWSGRGGTCRGRWRRYR